MSSASKSSTPANAKLPPRLKPGYVIGRAGPDSTDPSYIACQGIFLPSPGFKGIPYHNGASKQHFYFVSNAGPFKVYTNLNGVRKFGRKLHVKPPFPARIEVISCKTAAEVPTTLHAQCLLMHTHKPNENPPVPPHGDIVWEVGASSTAALEEEADELESEEDTPLALGISSKRPLTHVEAKVEAKVEEVPKADDKDGDAASQQQQKERENSDVEGSNAGGDGEDGGAAQQQQQQHVEGGDACSDGDDGEPWYLFPNGEAYCDAKAAQQVVNNLGGFVKILTSLRRLKSNPANPLWFVMPNGDSYTDAGRAEAVAQQSGCKVMITHGLKAAGELHLVADSSSSAKNNPRAAYVRGSDEEDQVLESCVVFFGARGPLLQPTNFPALLDVRGQRADSQLTGVIRGTAEPVDFLKFHDQIMSDLQAEFLIIQQGNIIKLVDDGVTVTLEGERVMRDDIVIASASHVEYM
ncbi:hypothetical protein B0H17DRAFT_1140120 [Mycena rosella]|uniref:Uncharacterized protein n=1 Tax=Mycena rosella TaxID=1033263 RepID=A0AAD7D2P1_MYCRO|nr:hypothetical protein B0H17DRAFT_1140120 [Mycena rosella]